MNLRKGMGSHQSASMLKDEWLTPPELLHSLGKFDLDPCAPINRPWPTANKHYTIKDDGLSLPWLGSVWCNPPYGLHTTPWLEKLYNHRNGVALIFARTETKMFFDWVWNKADAVFFLYGRLYFHHVNGQRAAANAGAPSALIVYGKQNIHRITSSKIPGKLILL